MATLEVVAPEPEYKLTLTQSEARVLRAIIGRLAGSVPEVSAIWDAMHTLQSEPLRFACVNDDPTRPRVDRVGHRA